MADLGAEGTQRYTDPQDILPGINGAQNRITAYMGGFLAEKKGSEESLRELTRTVIYQTNTQGGIWIDDPALDDTVWTVLAVFAEPEVTQGSWLPTPPPNDWTSRVRVDLAFAGSRKRVKRITLEMVPDTYDSLGPGSERLSASLTQYAYYWVGNRSTFPGGDFDTNGRLEMVVLPKSKMNSVIVGVSFLRVPPPITAIGQQIPFPSSMFALMRALSLNELTYKQGDGTTLNGLTQKDIGLLLNIQS